MSRRANAYQAGAAAGAGQAAVPLSVVLLGEQQVLLAGVQHALEQDGIAVCGTASRTAQALSTLHASAAQICLVLSPLAGGVVAAVAELRAELPEVNVVVVSADEDLEGQLLLAAMSAGADGWLSLDLAPNVLGRTLRAVRDGEPGISRQHVRRLLHVLRHPGTATVSLAEGREVVLTAREQDVLAQLGRDTSTAAMARRLVVSESTARWHIAGLIRKLGVSSRDEAAALAARRRPTSRP